MTTEDERMRAAFEAWMAEPCFDAPEYSEIWASAWQAVLSAQSVPTLTDEQIESACLHAVIVLNERSFTHGVRFAEQWYGIKEGQS